MAGKGRLEEIETKYLTLTVSSEKNGTEYTEVDVEDLVFLIQNGFKQAERVKELEEDLLELIKQNKELRKSIAFYSSESYNAHLERLLDRREQQIKRYREALEFYAKEYGADRAIQVLEGEE